jgi:hypothetical protein
MVQHEARAMRQLQLGFGFVGEADDRYGTAKTTAGAGA